jgi:uncharacterized membrane protein YhaH (DUF805 family)
MNGNLDLRDLFFSADGRIARTPFWLGATLLLMLLALYQSVDSVTLHWVTGWFVYPLLTYPAVCVLSKRLHDRGKSGWFAAPIILAMISVFSAPFGFFDFAWSLVLVWTVVELGFMAGEQGANRFGVSPFATA